MEIVTGSPLGWFLGGILTIAFIGFIVWFVRRNGPEIKKDLKDTVDDIKGKK